MRSDINSSAWGLDRVTESPGSHSSSAAQPSPKISNGNAVDTRVACLWLRRKLDASQGLPSQDCGNLSHHEPRESFREFLAGVCTRAQPAGHSGDSPDGDASWVGAAGCGGGARALVVDRAGALCSLRTGLDLPLLCGAQPADHIRTPVVVVVGGSKDGGADTYREDGRGGSALHDATLGLQFADRNKPTKCRTTLVPRFTRCGWRGYSCRERGSRRREAVAIRNPVRFRHAQKSFPEDSSFRADRKACGCRGCQP
jgi:hypothetical protein